MMSKNQLNKEQWAQIKSWFNDLINEPKEQLDSLIADKTNDQRMQEALAEMLHVHHESINQTITPSQSAAAAMVAHLQLKSGDQFARYRILKVLGSGGMGEVYLAERNDQVTQKVALKVLAKHSMDQQTQARFDTERRILASLEHPNIARLIDADNEAGSPYYAMEFIDGVEVDEYCQSNQLDLNSRLNLFLQICEAVSHAHKNLIVHRDLKPSNILVNFEGEVKLLDFGIAKPLKILPGTHDVHQTVLGNTALTPQYAAPEQVNGDAITVSCDIYVLGLLLYKLVTGQDAFDLANKTWGEIETIINQNMPTLPSRAIKNDETGLVSSWQNKVKGDLDAIISHALKKSPAERYESVRQMADDLLRYMQHEPLSIKKNQSMYRLKKQLRKFWFPVSAFATLFLVLLVSSVWIWQQSLAIEAERDKAVIEKNTAEAFSNILIESFKNADPTLVLTNDLKASQVLTETTRLMTSKGYKDSQVKSKIMQPIMEVLNNLSESQQVIDLYDSLKGQELESLSIDILAELFAEKIRAMNDLELQAEAMVLFQKTDNIAMHDTVPVLLAKALTHRKLYEWDEAEKILEQLYNLESKDHYYNICIEYSRALQWRMSEKNADVLLGCKAYLANSNESNLEWKLHTIDFQLAQDNFVKGQLEEAKLKLSEIFAFRKKAFGEDHIALAEIYNYLSSVHYELKQYDEATRYSKKNLEIKERQYGPNNVKMAAPIFNFGVQYHSRDMFDEAEKHILQAISILESHDVNHTRLGFFYTGLGILYLDYENYAVALDAMEKAKEIYSLKLNPKDFNLAKTNVLLAIIHNELGDKERAKALLLDDDSYEVLMAGLPDTYPDIETFENLYKAVVK